ncbi:hypothetical protein FBQ97_13140 [Acidobacteria bacterium ACD]|nr:MAG: hypothetical protein EDX89_21065 [Acidobacteriota bacterium]MCE7957743.1 hypothetical protein [Acidobacteria bacterium ACB2]MDL1950742.1 hypothetical protein [Acidobacteria bacterium ACD]
MRRIACLLLAALALVLPAAAAPQQGSPEKETYTVECTFTNPSYPGPCAVSEVVPRSLTPEAACGRVLSCLNDARCVTKTYCNATTVRGGWKLVSAAEAKAPLPGSGTLSRPAGAVPPSAHR